jgi:class 3 adenylate cyclase
MLHTKKSEMDGLHQEIKFIASANTQIKFYNQQLPRNIFERLGTFLKVLGMKVDDEHFAPVGRPAARKEIYFDNHWCLFKQAKSLSIRTHNGNDIDGPGSHVLILRVNNEGDAAEGLRCLSRNEYRRDLEQADVEAFIKDGITVDNLSTFFPHQDLGLDGNLRFSPRGEVNIFRNWYLAGVDDQEYFVYIDHFNFVKYDGGLSSEFYTEIDIERRFDTIESENCSLNFHERIIQFANVLKTAFDIEPDATPKYKRFHTFCQTEEMEDFFFVGFDVANYSNQTSVVQMHLCQRFHQIIREEVDRCGLTGQAEPIKISIGDGAIIAAQNLKWNVVVDILEGVKKAVARHNRETGQNGGRPNVDASDVLQIRYHTGIHYGPVYRFTDLNGMTNLAGDGISTLARVLHEASEGQVLLSEDAHRRIKESSFMANGAFTEVGARTVKHDKSLHLFEYRLD